MEGWIILHRKSWDHWLYKTKKPKTRREAWEDILMTVNYEDGKVLIKGQIVECKRSQSLLSLESWARLFNWSKQQVRDYFNLLKKDEMITLERLRYTTRLTVCNYDHYQFDPTHRTHTKKHSAHTLPTPIKEIKEINKEKNNNTMSEYSDSPKDLFDKFRKAYPGTKRGLDVEYQNFLKKNSPEIVEKLLPALQSQISHRNNLEKKRAFVPEWKNLQTWINQKCWTEESPEVMDKNGNENKGLSYQEMLSRCSPSFTSENFEPVKIAGEVRWFLRTLQTQN